MKDVDDPDYHKIIFSLLSLLVVTFGLVISPVFATVENLTVSPSVLVVDQPITFSGTDIVTQSKAIDSITLFIYLGTSCPPYNPLNPGHGSLAFGFATYDTTGAFISTLSFPAQLPSNSTLSSHWTVSSSAYQYALPAGSYSVFAIDAADSQSLSAGVCAHFTITNS